MKIAIEEGCQLTTEQMNTLIVGRWQNPSQINFNFQFETAIDAILLLKKDYPDLKIVPLSSSAQNMVREILDRWKQACDYHINFKFTPDPLPNELGITFIACKTTEFLGITVYPFFDHGFFDQILICLPTTLEIIDIKTISHEIGHALGLDHLYDNHEVLTHLKNISEGQGCSVMPYTHLMKTAANECKTVLYCEQAPYAIYPGPLDAKLCQYIYKPHKTVGDQQRELVLLGFLIGLFEKSINAFLIDLKIHNAALMSPTMAKSTALLINVMLQTYLQGPSVLIGNALTLIELISLYYQESPLEYLNYLKTLANLTSITLLLIEAYSSDNPMYNIAFLVSFLGGNLSGLLVSQCVGQKAASLTNKVIDMGENACKKVSTLLNFSFFRTAKKSPDKAISVAYMP